MSIYQTVSLAFYFVFSAMFAPLLAQTWLDLDNGLVCQHGNAGVGYQLEVHPETNQLHAAGILFHNFHCDTMRSVVYWDGDRWRAYPRANGATYRAVKVYQGQVYSHALFSPQYNLVRLNQSQEWESISELTDNTAMFRMREIDGALYGAVTYGEVPSKNAALLFKWDGQTMEAPIDTAVTSVMNGYDV